MEVYFSNNYITLYYNKEFSLGKAVWKGQLRGPELREAYLLVLDLVDRLSLTRWLADDRLMSTIDPDDLAWSMKVYVPRLAKSSLLRMARLPSHFSSNRQAVNEMIRTGYTLADNLTLCDFETEEEAMAWLVEPFRNSNSLKPSSPLLASDQVNFGRALV